MTDRARRGLRRWLGALVAIVLLAALALGFMQRHVIRDYFQATTFDPSPRMSQIIDDLELTARGDRIFRASQPTIDGSQHFNTQCADVAHSDEGHVLGCYSDQRIRLFDVKNKQISDIVEVTAAHELLHAAYARLSEGRRTELNRDLKNAFEELSKNDPVLTDRMAVYDQLSASAYANELHSVLGTEVRSLPEELEMHYAEYFTKREDVLDRFDAFHSVFTELEAQADSVESEMTALRADVERRNAEYDGLVEQFNLDAADFKERNDRYEFSGSVEEFNRIQEDLRVRRDALSSMLAELQADIQHYNDLREQLKELGQTSSDLDQQLNSSVAPPSTRPEG